VLLTLLALLATAGAAEITVLPTDAGLQARGPDGAVLTAQEFAWLVGDVQTAAAIRAAERRLLHRTLPGAWIGTGVALTGTNGVIVGAMFEAPNEMARMGAASLVGAAGAGMSGPVYHRQRAALDELDRWYTADQVAGWIEAPTPMQRRPSLVPTSDGYEVVIWGGSVGTRAFARSVGDVRTLQTCRFLRAAALGGGILAIYGGSLTLILGTVMVGPLFEPAAALWFVAIAVPQLAAGTGLLFVYRALDRPQTWYSYNEAQAWIDQSTAASQQSQRPELQLAVAPALLPDQGRLAPGVGLSGRW
jgi:hypothetical protein